MRANVEDTRFSVTLKSVFSAGLHDLVQVVRGIIGKRVDLRGRKYELAQGWPCA